MPSTYRESPGPIACAELQEVMDELKVIKRSLETIELARWAHSGAIPTAFKQGLTDAFRCKICQNTPFVPPIILARCCTNIIGCQTCVDRWFSGPNALQKNCPICQQERGYAQTVRLHGLDEFTEEVRKLVSTADLDSEEAADSRE